MSLHYLDPAINTSFAGTLMYILLVECQPLKPLKLVCFNLVQTFMYTLYLAPTGSGYQKMGEKA